MDKLINLKLETCKNYTIATITVLLLFITYKNVIPIYVYTLFASVVAFYFFPARLIVAKNDVINRYERTLLLITGIVFSTILVFSILNLYIPESSFLGYTAKTFGFINLCIIVYGYIKFNNFLVLNFIFSFITPFFTYS